MDLGITDRTAVVTGGAGRIGSEDCRVLAEEGAEVVVLDVNLTGTYNNTREVFPHMKDREWGRIITMSSIAGWRGGFGQISYSATKSALLGFGKSLALEGGKHGITSNILTPTVVVGELAELPQEQLEAIDENFARLAEATPMGHLGREEDVAPLVAFLASEHAEYITGQVVGVTGGADLLYY